MFSFHPTFYFHFAIFLPLFSIFILVWLYRLYALMRATAEWLTWLLSEVWKLFGWCKREKIILAWIHPTMQDSTKLFFPWTKNIHSLIIWTHLLVPRVLQVFTHYCISGTVRKVIYMQLSILTWHLVSRWKLLCENYGMTLSVCVLLCMSGAYDQHQVAVTTILC